MDTVNILVTMGFRFTEADFDQWRAVDPRVRVHGADDRQRPFLREPGDGSDPAEQEITSILHEADVLLASYDLVAGLRRRAPALRWMHTISAGVDRYLEAEIPWPGLLLTTGSGPSEVPIAEHVLMSILALAKGLPGSMRNQQEHRWKRPAASEVRGKTVGVVGLGHIGREAGRLAAAIGCRVIGIRRSATRARENVDGVDLLLPPGDLPRLLAESDFVVLAAPATSETAALIDAEALGRMKPGAFLINIARGSLVDEPALIEALKAGRLAGASLDVFQSEPLAAESELWDLPQVLITPHSSSLSEHSMRRHVELFGENLRRYLADEPLLNLVDPAREY